MELLFVGIGGMLGSLARYQLGRLIAGKSKSVFPMGTFLINVSGAILLGIVNGLGVNRSLSVLLADGFLGAYTTFSTFMVEGFQLFQNKKWNAVFYIGLSLVLGVAGYAAGYYSFKALIG